LQFKNWLNLYIFVDLDETLIKSKPVGNIHPSFIGNELYQKLKELKEEEQVQLLKEKGEKVLKFDNYYFITRVRPNAHYFLKELSKLGEVSILTSGGTQFQTTIIKFHELPVEKVYGREDYNKVPKVKNSILIDDLWLSTSGVVQKLNAMGHEIEPHQEESIHYINVKPWDGIIEDNELLVVLEEVKKRVK
jgi:hypothetical protein